MKTEGAQASGTLSLMQVILLIKIKLKIVHSRYSFTFQLPLQPLFYYFNFQGIGKQRIRNHELFFEFHFSLCSMGL